MRAQEEVGTEDYYSLSKKDKNREKSKNPHASDLSEPEFDYPAVQYYTLLSQAGSFTDFHAGEQATTDGCVHY